MIPLFAKTRRARRGSRLLLATLVLAGLTALGLWLQPTPEQLHRSLGATGGYAPVIFVATGILLITFFVPKTAVSLAAGALFGTAFGSLIMVAVAMGAAALNYGLARWLVRDQWARWSAERPHWDAVRSVTQRGDFRLHLLLRLAPIPTMVIGYACGAAGSRFTPFMLAAGAAVGGQVLWIHSGAVASGMLGSEGAGGSPAIAQWASLAVTVTASIALAVYLKRYVTRELARVA